MMNTKSQIDIKTFYDCYSKMIILRRTSIYKINVPIRDFVSFL